MNLKLFINSLFLFFISAGFAQEFKEVAFIRKDASIFDVEKVNSLKWDSLGGAWFVSEKGLSRHNGYQLYIFEPEDRTPNSIISDSIRSFDQTGPNEFWFTYWDSEYATKLNAKEQTFEHIHLSFIDTANVEFTFVVRVKKDHNNKLWFLTWGGGAFQLKDDQSFLHEKFELASDTTEMAARVKDFTQYSENEYLVCFFDQGNIPQRQYPILYNIETREKKAIPFNEYFNNINDPILGNRMKIVSKIINSAYVDENKKIWLLSYSGVIYLDLEKGSLKRIHAKGEDIRMTNLVNARTFLRVNDELWIVTANLGIARVNLKTHDLEYAKSNPNNNQTLYDNRTMSISRDPLGNVWICSSDGMMSIYTPVNDGFNMHLWSAMELEYSNRAAQPIPVNQMLVRKDGTVYISDLNYINIYNPSIRKISDRINLDPTGKFHQENPHYRVENFKIHGDSLIASINGKIVLYSFKNRVNLKNYGSRGGKTMLFRHSENNLVNYYVAGRDKRSDIISKTFGKEENEFELLYETEDDLTLSETYSHVLPSGNWMISEKYGRFVIYNPKTKSHRLFSPSRPDSFFPDSTVRIAFVDGEDIWIGTSKGLYLFHENNGEVINYNKEIGIQNEEVNAIVKDNYGVFWIALHSELLSWNPRNNDTKRYNQELGVKVGSFLPAIGQHSDGGDLYFATLNGILIFNPIGVNLPEFPLNIDLMNVEVNTDSLNAEQIATIKAGNYQFHWSSEDIVFKFYTNQVFSYSPHQFFYRLKEKNQKWIPNGPQNMVRLSNLRHGDYTLEVKAKNAFGIESETYEIRFSVSQPFWLAWWFWTIIIVILISLIYFYIKKREQKLKERSELLERKVEERTAEVVEQKKEADRQREMVEEKQKEITDSINYAKRIQEAIMPSQEHFHHHFENGFILYKPKDIVAGDFYWMEEINENELIFAAADCTGHGVPGAMVSVVCNNALNRSVREFKFKDPAKILDQTRELVIEQFEKKKITDSTGAVIKDGMDISLCYFNKSTKELHWAGANNPIWFIRNGKLEEIKGDKQPIGQYHEQTPFTSHKIVIQENDIIYIFSDGYADQFGGDKGKKFKTKAFKELLVDISNKTMTEQKAIIDQAFEKWKGDYEQVDDVCVIGINF